MPKLSLVAVPILAACSTVPAASPPPAVHGETPGHICTTAGTDAFIGQTRTDAIGAAITRVSNAAALRWAPPGVMLTMDYRADRVTVHLDSANKITEIKCG